ncbi:MAG TPA: hypothetical protein VK742_20175 [Candidatus Sulfotelmatobacter sp.]|jgi:hypothetical protein|nr:hypothetical protein [Candidatus Sulfotelmatobacter sp.]
MKLLILGAVCAVGLLFNTGCASCKSCKAATACDGGCCKDPATCAKCCGDAAGCAKCCKKS